MSNESENVPAVVEAPKGPEMSKELGEVFDALESVIADIRAKKPMLDIAKDNFEKLKNAVEGYDQLSDELKDKAKSFPTIGYHLGKILSSF